MRVRRHRDEIQVRARLDNGRWERYEFAAADVASIHVVLLGDDDRAVIDRRIDLDTSRYCPAGAG